MISKANFIKLFHKNIKTDLINFNFSSPNEENVSEFQVNNSKNQFNYFHTYQNRIYISCEIDLDINLVGTFESIDGETKQATFQYDTVKAFVTDLDSLLAWYDTYA
jgi:hypothetical protein